MNVGSVVEPRLRKRTKWRKSGVMRRMSTVVMATVGEGLRIVMRKELSLDDGVSIATEGEAMVYVVVGRKSFEALLAV
jgi:hypothetical protein